MDETEELQQAEVEELLSHGHVVVQGEFAGNSARVAITPYAQRRMIERDVLEEEVLEALGRPLSQHGPGKVEGRREVTAKVNGRMLTVVYRRSLKGCVVVITVFVG